MFSLVITVLNERQNLQRWLESILNQTVLPDEIVVVDGGSTDGTRELLDSFAAQNKILKVFSKPGNIASGRNYGISQASSDIIVVTDAGCIYNKEWFRKLTNVFANPNVAWAASAFGPWLEREDNMGKYLIAAATTPAPSEFRKDWLPSSRSVAFRKDVWEKVGSYPEWIPICEDIVFDLAIIKLFGKPTLVREPLVFWRPRPNWRAFLKQLYRYTKSDGHGNLWLGRQLTRYTVYGAAVILLWLAGDVSWLFVWPIILGLFVYCWKFWKRWLVFTQTLPTIPRLIGLVVLPIVIALGDCAKMAGWPVGVYERIMHKKYV